MKKNRFNLTAFTVLVLACLLLVGCDGVNLVPVDTTTPKLDNSMPGGKLELTHPIDGEEFILHTQYFTDYDTSKWRVTEPKTISMRAWPEILPGGEGDEIFIEHVHVDMSLMSTQQNLDGWSQDSMDDTFHGTSQPGFVISPKYYYENIFAVEGFSQTLISGWMFAVGSYGSGSISQNRLTEENLVKYGGVYANKLMVVYDISVRHAGETYFHTHSVTDALKIPVSYNPATTTK